MPEQLTIPSVSEQSYGTEALTLSHDIHRKRWIFHCGYDSRHIAKDHGFYWDKTEREWYTVDPFSAMKLIHYADPECRKKLAKYWNFAAGNFQDSQLSSGELKQGHQDIHIPIPHGCTIRDYQRIGVEFLVRSDERCSNTLLADEMGCLSGDTELVINRGGAARRMSLKDAHQKWTSSWDRTIPTKIRALCDGQLRLHTIREILSKGIKPVVKLTLASGKTLTLTSDHEIAAPDDKWIEAGKLVPGNKVLTNGQAACLDCKSTEGLITYKYAKFAGLCKTCVYRKHRVNRKFKTGKFKDMDGYIRVSGQHGHHRAGPGGFVYEHILVMEKHLNRAVVWPEQVHHINEDKADNRIENLQLVSCSEHHRIHERHLNIDSITAFIPKVDVVVSVEPAGETAVYDIVMDDPHRNFVANGIIVHNCGKTIMIIAALNYLSDALSGRKLRRALIVSPASLKLNWGRELRKWLVGPLSWGIADSQGFPRNRDIVIINYDILEKWQPIINSISWDLLVADEAHYLKNPGTKRSKLFYGIAADRRIYATGTPIVNRPRELFPLVNSLDVEQFPKFISFAIRYCSGRKIGSTWDFSGASNLEELQARLRATIMLRRLKKDVLTELPPKTRNIIELPAPRGIGDLLRRELEAYNEKEPMLEALKVRIAEAKSANDTAAYSQAVDQFRATTGEIMGEVSTLRKEVAIAKVPLVIAYLEDLWKGDPERKIVLWCHHHVVMDAFMERFKSFGTTVDPKYAMKFSGNETIQKRDETVQRFQNDPRFLLFIGQTLAGGVGITLTASNHCIFAELDWVPGNITQAEDRLHRIGQLDNVLVEHLVLEGSLDCRIAQRVVEKQMVIDAAMNTKTEHLNQHSMMSA